MIKKYEKIFTSLDEMKEINRTDPYNVVGLYVHAICNYEDNNPNKLYEMIQYLLGEFQPLSELMKQNLKDRMLQNDKYKFIGKSYFVGATPKNDYTPTIPYEIEIKENPYTDSEEGYKKLFLKSGGADSDRPITLRLAKDGNYYLWSDSFIGILSDIRPIESTNPWA